MEINIKKGLNLRIEGEVKDPTSVTAVTVDRVAVYPDDFEGFVPKTEVRVGDRVRLGDALLHDKNDDRIKLVSPVSGQVTAIERGERRHIDRIIVTVDSTANDAKQFDTKWSTVDEALGLLAESGLLVFVRQRPYAIVPSIGIRPRDIFVTGFDSAPLAVDRQWTQTDKAALEAGAGLLAAVTKGKVYVSVRKESDLPDLANIERVIINGPHPAGLPGIQAANIAPVNKGESIWTLSVETMWRIGRLLTTGTVDTSALVAVTGSAVAKTGMVSTITGAHLDHILKGRLIDTNHHLRIISGNVLTGVKADGYLRYPYTQITVIPEGDDVDEFMGWASFSPFKMSVSPTYPGSLLHRIFAPDARINGGRRAMIMSGEYDRVLPMDILAEYLIKAIDGRDIEGMENLGIYEVAPEDFALAECLDSSKLPLQRIVREGLDYLRKELE